MTDREKKELIEAEETILQLFFDAYERAMKYTKGNINLSVCNVCDGRYRHDTKQGGYR